MIFEQMIKRLATDAFMFFALLVNLYFLYSQMFSFVYAAIILGYVNGQTVSFTIYTLLLFCLPLVLLLSRVRPSKPQILRILFYCFAAVIMAGTICDLVTYNFFNDYSFKEGDTVFVNIMWNMPDLWGALFSLVISVLYFNLGIWIKRRRTISLWIYLSIFILTCIVPFLYTFLASGTLPRITWMQKALFLSIEQFLILLGFSVCASSRTLWAKHLWSC